MQHTRQLRMHLAADRARKALALARSRRFADALVAVEECVRLDPTLPHPHVIAAKIHFWRGELERAEKRLTLALSCGGDQEHASAMRMAIDGFRARRLFEREAAAVSRARTSARLQQLREGGVAIAAWFDQQRLTQIFFLLGLLACLSLGGLR